MNDPLKKAYWRGKRMTDLTQEEHEECMHEAETNFKEFQNNISFSSTKAELDVLNAAANLCLAKMKEAKE